jgi:hypothetical protein
VQQFLAIKPEMTPNNLSSRNEVRDLEQTESLPTSLDT